MDYCVSVDEIRFGEPLTCNPTLGQCFDVGATILTSTVIILAALFLIFCIVPVLVGNGIDFWDSYKRGYKKTYIFYLFILIVIGIIGLFGCLIIYLAF